MVGDPDVPWGRLLAAGFGWTAGHGLLFAAILMVSSSARVGEVLRQSPGFVAALSAFLLGAVVANTGLGHPLERTLPGLGSFSVAVFLVATGMLFDFDLLRQSWPWGLIGRALAAAFALVVVGHPTGVAVSSPPTR